MRPDMLRELTLEVWPDINCTDDPEVTSLPEAIGRALTLRHYSVMRGVLHVYLHPRTAKRVLR